MAGKTQERARQLKRAQKEHSTTESGSQPQPRHSSTVTLSWWSQLSRPYFHPDLTVSTPELDSQHGICNPCILEGLGGVAQRLRAGQRGCQVERLAAGSVVHNGEAKVNDCLCKGGRHSGKSWAQRYTEDPLASLSQREHPKAWVLEQQVRPSHIHPSHSSHTPSQAPVRLPSHSCRTPSHPPRALPIQSSAVPFS